LKKNPLVTIYITNYNYGRYLKKSIESIFEQTFKDFELLIIDDGSNDDSKRIIKEYDDRYNVFSVFQQNKGLNASNNVALKLARGKYIIRLDADDYFAPQALEIMVSDLERNPEHALVFPDYYLVNEEEEVIQQVHRHDFSKDVTLPDQPAHGACTMIRTSVLKSVGGYDQTFTRQDGYDLWLNITNQYPVRNINLPLFYYRLHGKNITMDEKKLLETRSKIKAKHVKKRGLKPISVLAIVPVRGQAIDPRSNPMKKLGDKCLIDWTIESALASKLLLDIVVTTPDNDIINHINKKYGSKIITVARKEELAQVNTSIEETAIDVFNQYKKCNETPDAIMMLYIECPFRSTMYINKAINTMQLYDVDIVDGVKPDDNMFYVHTGNGLEPWHKNKRLRLERDELYRRVGGIHLISRETLERTKDMLGGKIGHIVLDRQAAFSIRCDIDWAIANILVHKKY